MERTHTFLDRCNVILTELDLPLYFVDMLRIACQLADDACILKQKRGLLIRQVSTHVLLSSDPSQISVEEARRPPIGMVL